MVLQNILCLAQVYIYHLIYLECLYVVTPSQHSCEIWWVIHNRFHGFDFSYFHILFRFLPCCVVLHLLFDLLWPFFVSFNPENGLAVVAECDEEQLHTQGAVVMVPGSNPAWDRKVTSWTGFVLTITIALYNQFSLCIWV